MKESEIRPQEIFNEYLRLAEIDVETYFSHASYYKISCPACGEQGDFAFRKKGFDYDVCGNCHTLYVSPRPEKEAFDRYYTDSPSTEYWATTFYKSTEEARREKLWKPKAQLIKSTLERYTSVEHIIDIGGGYGVFDEEIMRIMDIKPLVIEPSVHLAEICRQKGFPVIEKFLEEISASDLPQGKKCFVSFELFEHLHDPAAFLATLKTVVNRGDIFIFTTLSGMGVDIQTLWQHSKSVSPPHHLNFFNPKSVALLLEKLGFRVLEATTPGKLDIDIMDNNLDFVTDRFWRNFLMSATPDEKSAMQRFIAENGLSSHMMIVCSA